MLQRRDNYKLQMAQAKAHFLTYDQQEIISRCHLRHDENYFYIPFLGKLHRLCRKTGNVERLVGECWQEDDRFGLVMTLLDWLCDSRPDRYITGRFLNIVTQASNFHRNLQETQRDPDAELFSANPEAFCAACEALGGTPATGADIAYTIEVLDGVQVLLKLWHPDEDFPAKLLCLWEENVLRYIRYETTWYALGVLLSRLKEQLQK